VSCLVVQATPVWGGAHIAAVSHKKSPNRFFRRFLQRGIKSGASPAQSVDDQAGTRRLPVPAMDHHQHPDADHVRHHRTAAVTDEGKGDADHGSETHHHQEIDRDEEEYGRGHSGSEKLRKPVIRVLGHLQTPEQDRAEAKDNEYPTGEAPFLCHRREHEIGMWFGEVVEMTLRSFVEAFAKETA